MQEGSQEQPGAEEQCLGAASREGSAADSHSLSGRCRTMQLCFQACPPSFPPASQERPLWLLIHIPFKSVTSGKPGALQAPPSLLRAVSCRAAASLGIRSAPRCVHTALSAGSTPGFHWCYISPGAPG